MFPLISSSTNDVSLEKFTEILSSKDIVDGFLIAGSGGKRKLLPYSDYDFVIVLSEMPVKLFSAFTYVDGRMADVFFYTRSQIDELISKKEPIDANSMDGKLVEWLKDGNIPIDKSGKLHTLKEKTKKEEITQVKDSTAYAAWFATNFNFTQNNRMFESNNPLYLQAVEIRLLTSFFNIFNNYFDIRKIPFRGEKEAIKYLEKYDKDYLELFQRVIKETDKKIRFNLYEKLVELTVKPVAEVWGQRPITGVMPQEEMKEDTIQKGLEFWEALTKNE